MNTQQLSPETIATLAEWDGWEKERREFPCLTEKWAKNNVRLSAIQLSDHFTDPRTLIRLRIGVEKAIRLLDMKAPYSLITDGFELDGLILTGQYYAAADKVAEIIKKLKG